MLAGGRGGGPVVDGWFLPDEPANIFAQGKQNDVPILVGSNKDEGTFFSQPTTAAAWIQRAKQRYGDMADPVPEAVSGRIGCRGQRFRARRVSR